MGFGYKSRVSGSFGYQLCGIRAFAGIDPIMVGYPILSWNSHTCGYPNLNGYPNMMRVTQIWGVLPEYDAGNCKNTRITWVLTLKMRVFYNIFAVFSWCHNSELQAWQTLTRIPVVQSFDTRRKQRTYYKKKRTFNVNTSVMQVFFAITRLIRVLPASYSSNPHHIRVARIIFG